MPLLSIDDPVELHALWRMMFDAKFHAEPRDADLWASPVVHSLARRIDEARLKAYEVEGKPEFILKHQEWQKSMLENPFVMAAFREKTAQVAQTAWWKGASREEKLALLRGCAAPFVPADVQLEALLSEAEA